MKYLKNDFSFQWECIDQEFNQLENVIIENRNKYIYDERARDIFNYLLDKVQKIRRFFNQSVPYQYLQIHDEIKRLYSSDNGIIGVLIRMQFDCPQSNDFSRYSLIEGKLKRSALS